MSVIGKKHIEQGFVQKTAKPENRSSCLILFNKCVDCMFIASSIKTAQTGVMSYSMNVQKQSGAAEACWAHNPEVQGSKPCSASGLILKKFQDKISGLPGGHQKKKKAFVCICTQTCNCYQQ